MAARVINLRCILCHDSFHFACCRAHCRRKGATMCYHMTSNPVRIPENQLSWKKLRTQLDVLHFTNAMSTEHTKCGTQHNDG